MKEVIIDGVQFKFILTSGVLIVAESSIPFTDQEIDEICEDEGYVELEQKVVQL